MSLELQSISFNHPADASTKCSLNIRRNFNDIVRMPEWSRTANVVRSLEAAYVIGRVLEDFSNLTLRVSLQSTDNSLQAATVRAVSRHSTEQDNFGDVVAKRVQFPDAGAPVIVDFNLTNSQLLALGVNAYNVVWDWQFSPTGNAGDFQSFDESRHKIYAVLARPTLPWTHSVDDDQLPWAEVLDWACKWAQGAQDVDEAATLITKNVFGLGHVMVDIDEAGGQSPLIEYDCPHSGAHHYIDIGIFRCSRFLKRLKLSQSDGPFINCDDCAAIVSTFANILGCDLAQVMMGRGPQDPFNLNPTILIGAPPNDWKVGCPGTLPDFSHHTVAWKGNANSSGRVFDGCLMVDGDNDPTGPPSSPHVALLPTEVQFGGVDGTGYRFRLASGPRSNRAKCSPLGSPSRKRVI